MPGDLVLPLRVVSVYQLLAIITTNNQVIKFHWFELVPAILKVCQIKKFSHFFMFHQVPEVRARFFICRCMRQAERNCAEGTDFEVFLFSNSFYSSVRYAQITDCFLTGINCDSGAYDFMNSFGVIALTMFM